MRERRVGFYLEMVRKPFDKSVSNEQLFEELHRVKTLDEKQAVVQKILEHNVGFVTHLITNKFYNPQDICEQCRITYDEMFSDGMYGLLKAIYTYKAEYKIKFISYAGRCISNELNMMVRGLQRSIQVVSLNERIYKNDSGGEEVTLIDLLESSYNPLDEFEKEEDMLIFLDELEKIIRKPTDLDLLGMYFFEDRTQAEIADLLGISKSYVSHKILKVITRAKKLYKESHKG